jgi:methanogenic corrinoid protein MtbC1
MCDECATLGPDQLSDKIASIAPIARFMREMWSLGRSGPLERYREVLNRARELNIGPADLLVGLVSPLMASLGKHWETGRVSIAEEHRFTAFYEAVLQEIRAGGDPLHPYLDSNAPQVLLVNCDGNYHTVGARVVEIWLAERGVSSLTFVPGLPPSEIVAEAKRLRPAVVGISMSMREQLPAAVATAQQVMAETPCRVLLGGYAVKSGAVTADDLPGARLVAHAADLAGLLPMPGVVASPAAR